MYFAYFSTIANRTPHVSTREAHKECHSSSSNVIGIEWYPRPAFVQMCFKPLYNMAWCHGNSRNNGLEMAGGILFMTDGKVSSINAAVIINTSLLMNAQHKCCKTKYSGVHYWGTDIWLNKKARLFRTRSHSSSLEWKKLKVRLNDANIYSISHFDVLYVKVQYVAVKYDILQPGPVQTLSADDFINSIFVNETLWFLSKFHQSVFLSVQLRTTKH